MNYTIDEMETLQTGNEDKLNEIQRINHQLNKALEVKTKTLVYLFSYKTILDSKTNS